MLNKILTSLANMYDEFNNEKATFPENDFLGIKYMAFSVKTDEDTNNWFHKMLVTYITDMDDCSGILDANNKKKIKCWLKLTDDIAYRGLKNNSSRYHRKLWDAYVAAADVVKSDASSNKNLLLFTSGYEESYYEAGSAIPGVLSEDNKSISTETDFFNAIKPEDNIPVFIAPEDRSDTDSFPTDNATDIDNKFYKLACLTNGAYFPYVNENSSWNPVKTSSYSVKGIMGNIREASYGMWRVKITLDSKTTDRFYEGGIVVKTNDITTELAGYRIVR
jgi:hypothetical protein